MQQASWIGRSDCRSCSNLHEVLFSDLSAADLDAIIQGIYEPIDHFTYETASILYRKAVKIMPFTSFVMNWLNWFAIFLMAKSE